MKAAVERLIAKVNAMLEAKPYDGDMQGGRPLLVAVDGRCAAGKTTFAKRIQRETGWSVLHMDDFFLRPEQRTAERLYTPGGNVDYERFLEEVLLPLKRGETKIDYRPFDCHRQTLTEPVRIRAGRVCLIEGSYSCHPALKDFYDLKVFLTIGRKAQEWRVLRRDGESAAVFLERWIPLEERYFLAYQIEEQCDLRFETDQSPDFW